MPALPLHRHFQGRSRAIGERRARLQHTGSNNKNKCFIVDRTGGSRGALLDRACVIRDGG